MNADPLVGVLLHAVGGLASASFYIPFRGVKHWAWETYWLVGGFFSWIIAPWAIALLLVPDLLDVLRGAPAQSLFWTYFFGVLWGVGGLTFGLTMRYLGISLGMAMALGYCALFGTLMPPLFKGELGGIVTSTSGLVVLTGVVVCLFGIVISGLAGRSKERELSAAQKQATIKEFSLFKGVLVATFAGIMSASMSYGFAAGKPIAELAVAHGVGPMLANIAVLPVVLAGGFTTNFLWCLILSAKNRTGRDYLNHGFIHAPDGLPERSKEKVPLFANYALSALAGVTWYMQFFFYGMGTTKMGPYGFTSWTLHMASIMIFGTLWGLALREWKGASRHTLRLVAFGLAMLVASTVVVGYGNYLAIPPTDLTAVVNPHDLRCEYLVDPLGIDAAKPRLSWTLAALRTEDRGLTQTAYQILVADDEEKLQANEGNLWDSGKVESDQSVHVEYGGEALRSRQRCYWKVRVWDQDAKPSAWSEPALWSMGLLEASDWTAQWIGLDEKAVEPLALKPAQWIWFPGGNPAVGAPVGTNYFRRTITLPDDRPVAKALCRVTADDMFVLFVNGNEVGAGKNWRQAAEIDFAKHLRPGTNTLAVAATNVFSKDVAPDKNPAGLIGVFRFEFAEGEPLVVPTDTQWRTSDKEAKGWTQTGFDDSTWPPAQEVGAYGIGPWGANIQSAEAEHRRLPARMLRRDFLVEKKVRRATAHVSGLGFFDLYVNGRLIGDQLMNPALTGYDKRVLYVTFDVTEQIQPGANAIGVLLGNGRYFAPRVADPVQMHNYGNPKLLFQMRLEYEDGSMQDIVSETSWKLTTEGPIRANSEYDGEEYDAGREQPSWSQPGFDDERWQKAQHVDPPGGALEAQMIEPIRVTEALKPVAVTNPKPGIYVVDFGQAFYGVVKLKVSGPAGTRVQMRTAFNVTPDALLKVGNDRSAFNLDIYTLKGDGVETWHPRFRGNATRRVQVEGFPGVPTAENFKGLVIHTDMEPVGQFTCSNDLINKIYSNARWGTRMQNRSVPMEPDRDERMPWSGHPAKTSESEAWAFNVARFYDHFLQNYRVHQAADGSLQEILPPYWTFNSKDIVWPSVITIIPDWYYNFYGDTRPFADNYECMKRWVQFCQKAYLKADDTTDYCNYGDWVDGSWIKDSLDKRTTSRPLLSTSYFYNNCRIVARAARLLGRTEDEKAFSDLADKVRAGFNRRFFNPNTNKYESETQGSYLFPLAFGLVPEDHRAVVIANFIEEITVKHHNHTSVGLVGMQWYMQVLTEIGHPEVAFAVATQTTRPSWGYMISKGATTIWEIWDSDIQGGGMNGESQKILSGNLEAWMYQTLAGINYNPDRPGFKHIVLRPRPVGDLTFVKASHRSPYGTIVSDWKIDNGSFLWNVTVPPNTTATVYVPATEERSVMEGGRRASEANNVKFLRMEADAAVYAVGSGAYSFGSSDWARLGR
jgi:alpha-L-rhamnosidase